MPGDERADDASISGEVALLVERASQGELDAQAAFGRLEEIADSASPGKVADALTQDAGADDPITRDAAMELLAMLAELHPGAVQEVIATVRNSLDDPHEPVQLHAMQALVDLASHDPDAAGEIVQSISRHLTADNPRLRDGASRVAAAVSSTRPSAVIPLVPGLVELVDAYGSGDEYGFGETGDEAIRRAVSEADPVEGEKLRSSYDSLEEDVIEEELRNDLARERALTALTSVAEAEPTALDGHIETLADALEGEAIAEIKTGILEILSQVARRDPELVRPSMDALVTFLDAWDAEAPRGVAARVLAYLADDDPDGVVDATLPVLPVIGDLLDADEEVARGGAAGLLTYVSEQAPERVEPMLPAVVDLVDDDAVSVRASAIWVIRFAGATDALDDIRRVAEADPDPEVRRLAEETAAQLRS